MSIGRQQPIGAQIASGRQKAVGFMQSLLERREFEVVAF
jgi:hypothetical protein